MRSKITMVRNFEGEIEFVQTYIPVKRVVSPFEGIEILRD